jgi:hypothetical protein
MVSNIPGLSGLIFKKQTVAFGPSPLRGFVSLYVCSGLSCACECVEEEFEDQMIYNE